MAGFTQAYQQTLLDYAFPTSAATDAIAYSVDGTSEWANLARTAVGATGWAAATAAEPSVKANNTILTSEAVTTAGGTVSHFCFYSSTSAGTQKTDWTALSTPRILAVGDKLEWAIGAAQVTLT